MTFESFTVAQWGFNGARLVAALFPWVLRWRGRWDPSKKTFWTFAGIVLGAVFAGFLWADTREPANPFEQG